MTMKALGIATRAALGIALGTAVYPAPPAIKVAPGHEKVGKLFWVGDSKDTVTFKSQAPLEDIVGTSNALAGYVAFDPAKPAGGAKGRLEVPVASINTGIPARNEHLQNELWLDAKRFPVIAYEIEAIKGAKPAKPGATDSWEMTLVGTFHLHGKTRKLEVPAKVAYMKESERTKLRRAGNLLVGRTTFELALKDFDVAQAGPGAKILGAKVADRVIIEVGFVASDTP